MKNKKGFIKIPLLLAIIAGILVLGGASYLGVKKYQSYQAEKIKKEVATQVEVDAKQKTQDEAQQQKDLEVEKLKQEVEALKNKKPQIIQQTIVKEVSTDKVGNSLAYIAQYWRPVVVYVECDAYGKYPSGEEIHIGYVAGSGTALYIPSSNQYIVWTNKHVIESSGGKLCKIWFPDTSSPLVSIKARVQSGSDRDFAIIDIPSPDVKTGSFIKTISSSSNFLCSQKPSIGEQVVILGYPGIGSQTDITVTEGIISGYDGDYFITSAKVEHGNSGGATILVKDNCYLGIPTFVETGTLESLARILDWHKFMK